jgi:hypothetical protein
MIKIASIGDTARLMGTYAHAVVGLSHHVHQERHHRQSPGSELVKTPKMGSII